MPVTSCAMRLDMSLNLTRKFGEIVSRHPVCVMNFGVKFDKQRFVYSRLDSFFMGDEVDDRVDRFEILECHFAWSNLDVILDLNVFY